MADELERKMVELQLLREQLEQYERHAVALMESGGELQVTRNAIEELGKLKNGSEVMLPLGNGVYVNAKLTDTKKLMTGVGSNVFLDKTVKETLKLIEGRIEKVEAGTNEISMQMQMLSSAIQRLNQDIEKLSKK